MQALDRSVQTITFLTFNVERNIFDSRRVVRFLVVLLANSGFDLCLSDNATCSQT